MDIEWRQHIYFIFITGNPKACQLCTGARKAGLRRRYKAHQAALPLELRRLTGARSICGQERSSTGAFGRPLHVDHSADFQGFEQNYATLWQITILFWENCFWLDTGTPGRDWIVDHSTWRFSIMTWVLSNPSSWKFGHVQQHSYQIQVVYIDGVEWILNAQAASTWLKCPWPILQDSLLILYIYHKPTPMVSWDTSMATW